VTELKELIKQLRNVVAFSGFMVETVKPHSTYVTMELKSKSLFRKKNYHVAISKSLTGLLAAERDLSRQFKRDIIILDPVNHLELATFQNVELVHDLDQLQEFLIKK
jgi:nucleoside-triphosphatase THEP1